jgi:hypothetical protein
LNLLNGEISFVILCQALSPEQRSFHPASHLSFICLFSFFSTVKVRLQMGGKKNTILGTMRGIVQKEGVNQIH